MIMRMRMIWRRNKEEDIDNIGFEDEQKEEGGGGVMMRMKWRWK